MIVHEGLPPEAYSGEMASLDMELYSMIDGKLHRPTGEFACLSIALERDMDSDNPTVYQIYDSYDLRKVVDLLKAGRWVLQNAVFDLRQMRRWATILPRPIWDTMLVDQELWGGYHSLFDLGSLSIRWLGEYMEKETRDEFQSATEMTPQRKEYAAKDALSTLRIAKQQMAYIEDNDEPFDFYWDADAPMIWVVLDMPPARIDVEGWTNLAHTFQTKSDEIRASLDFNPGSWQQVQKKIQEVFGFKIPSTDEEHLNDLKDKLIQRGRKSGLELIDNILAYRHYSKAAGTYGYNWIEKYLEDDEWVYTNWKICGAVDTSRMSSTDPNLQNIPARTVPEFRNLFIPGKGCITVGADVAQQEPRILAKLSGDKHLIGDLQSGISPHITTGRLVFSDPNFDKSDKAKYLTAKSINLGIPYGMSAAGIAAKAGISEEEAERHLATYFRGFPGVKLYMEKYRREAQRKEYVRNALGRRCWMNMHSYQWKNNAINAPIQSTAAHQTKIAGAFVHSEATRRGLPFCLTMFVHDEIVCDVPLEYKDAYIQLLCDAWTEAGRMTLGDTIPVVAEPFWGPNWGEKK
jgi:DNA polymerase-1